jgi:hypothetical protein
MFSPTEIDLRSVRVHIAGDLLPFGQLGRTATRIVDHRRESFPGHLYSLFGI